MDKNPDIKPSGSGKAGASNENLLKYRKAAEMQKKDRVINAKIEAAKTGNPKGDTIEEQDSLNKILEMRNSIRNAKQMKKQIRENYEYLKNFADDPHNFTPYTAKMNYPAAS